MTTFVPAPIMKPHEAEALRAAVRLVPPELHAHAVVEIGAGLGGSTLLLDRTWRESGGTGAVHTVDPIRLYRKHRQGRDQLSTLRAAFAGTAIRFHHMESTALRRSWADPVALLFIDGDHSLQAVREDMHWIDFVPPGGVVVMHDYDEGRGPYQAVQEWWADNAEEWVWVGVTRILLTLQRRNTERVA